MKNLLFIIICIVNFALGNAQIMNDIDEVYRLNDDLLAIKKDNQWAFINMKGEKVIDYRKDLVLTEKTNSFNHTDVYPVFNDGRCLIRKLISGTFYYGYINEKGEEIIKPQFLNATNFLNGFAIVVVLSKDSIGFNEVLKKAITSNNIEEYLIDTSGEKIKYLYNPRNYTPIVYKNKIPPIESKFVAPGLVAVKTKNQKWNLHGF